MAAAAAGRGALPPLLPLPPAASMGGPAPPPPPLIARPGWGLRRRGREREVAPQPGPALPAAGGRAGGAGAPWRGGSGTACQPAWVLGRRPGLAEHLRPAELFPPVGGIAPRPPIGAPHSPIVPSFWLVSGQSSRRFVVWEGMDVCTGLVPGCWWRVQRASEPAARRESQKHAAGWPLPSPTAASPRGRRAGGRGSSLPGLAWPTLAASLWLGVRQQRRFSRCREPLSPSPSRCAGVCLWPSLGSIRQRAVNMGSRAQFATEGDLRRGADGGGDTGCCSGTGSPGPSCVGQGVLRWRAFLILRRQILALVLKSG